MKMKSILAFVLACILLLLCACAPTVTPPAGGGGGGNENGGGDNGGGNEGGDGGEGEGGDEAPAISLTVTPSTPYASVGSVVSFAVAGNCDLSKVTFTLSDTSMAVGVSGKNGVYTMRLAKEGALVATVECEGTTASGTMFVFPEISEYESNDALITYLGRTAEEGNARVFRNTAAGFEVTFYGKKLVAEMTSSGRDAAMMAVLVDGAKNADGKLLDLTKDGKNGKFVLAEFDKAGVHTVRVQKVTEESISVASLRSLTVEDGGLLPAEEKKGLHVVAYGDSITCGYGNMRPDASVDGLYSTTQNGLLTYSALAAEMLGAEYEAFSRSGIGLYTNAHNMPYNMLDVYDYISPMSDGSQRWDMAANSPDIVVINLGTNDLGATQNKADSIPAGMPFYSNDGIRAAYVEFVEKLNAAYGEGVIYFLVGGMMTNSTNTAMQEAAALLQQQGINANVVVLPGRTGYGGHPLLDVHEAAAEVLYNAIVETYFG